MSRVSNSETMVRKLLYRFVRSCFRATLRSFRVTFGQQNPELVPISWIPSEQRETFRGRIRKRREIKLASVIPSTRT